MHQQNFTEKKVGRLFGQFVSHRHHNFTTHHITHRSRASCNGARFARPGARVQPIKHYSNSCLRTEKLFAKIMHTISVVFLFIVSGRAQCPVLSNFSLPNCSAITSREDNGNDIPCMQTSQWIQHISFLSRGRMWTNWLSDTFPGCVKILSCGFVEQVILILLIGLGCVVCWGGIGTAVWWSLRQNPTINVLGKREGGHGKGEIDFTSSQTPQFVLDFLWFCFHLEYFSFEIFLFPICFQFTSSLLHFVFALIFVHWPIHSPRLMLN